ncbi:MAG: MFS transporter, partial [Syntrophorhabdaceae bacterium]|nr:MFS transporter [Syntrophorhabdaceae bacterium]
MRGLVGKVFGGIGRNVVAISLVSFLNDISSEMVYPVVPIFLVTVLNAPVTIVGLIEGIAESTANLLRVFSGYFSDRSGRRKPFMTGGYALSALSKLVIGAASGWTMVMGGRFLDRFGKGVRTSARDALLAGVSEDRYRGRVFGFHRALDTLGAMIGPLIALVLLKVFEGNLRLIFYLAFLPAVAGVVLLVAFVHDAKTDNGTGRRLPWKLRDIKLDRSF